MTLRSDVSGRDDVVKYIKSYFGGFLFELAFLTIYCLSDRLEAPNLLALSWQSILQAQLDQKMYNSKLHTYDSNVLIAIGHAMASSFIAQSLFI